MARKITARVIPITTPKNLDTLATALAGAAGVDTAVVNPSSAERSTLMAHVFVTSDAVATAAGAKASMDAAFTAQGVAPIPGGGFSPLLESNDADDAVTISRAAGATTIRFTATDVDQAPDNSITFAYTTGGILASSITLTAVSDGVWDLAIDLAAGDNAGPYTVTATATDVQGNVATVTTVVTSAA